MKKFYPTPNEKGTNKATPNSIELKEREKEFLKLACSELTYNEIDSQMGLSPKTIDGYRIRLNTG